MTSAAFGRTFESLFENTSNSEKIITTRIPDGCKVVGKNHLIRVKSPFDWILSFRGKTALIDTKTTGKRYFQNSDINFNQAFTLRSHEITGNIAGYVVQLRGDDRTIFIPAENLILASPERGSTSQGLDLGSAHHFSVRKLFGDTP